LIVSVELTQGFYVAAIAEFDESTNEPSRPTIEPPHLN